MTNRSASPITVMVVDDSMIVRAVLRKLLAEDESLKLVASAENGHQALEMIREYEPDVICSDLNMPIMDGFEFTRAVMRDSPRPILILSTEVGAGNTKNIYRAIDAGAADVLPKPEGKHFHLTGEYETVGRELREKIKDIALRRRPPAHLKSASPPPAPPLSRPQAAAPVKESKAPGPETRPVPTRPSTPVTTQAAAPGTPLKVLCLGASEAVAESVSSFLSDLPRDFSPAIICVVNLRRMFLNQFMAWIGTKTSRKVEVAEDGVRLAPGGVYIVPSDLALGFGRDDRLKISPVESGTRRDMISRAFRLLADRHGKDCGGVLLTARAEEGLAGVEAIQRAGGLALISENWNVNKNLLASLPAGPLLQALVLDWKSLMETVARRGRG